ncbi:MAG: peptide chain release factor N(5)-glutamine methyltransferase [Verrucomicrobia bacterium]|nr:peptide chain release factor N(5)-glutamine methyltransferase [Verrucomicrobiota bacterium]
MKILELIQRTTEFFQRRGVDSPRLTIELMVAHVLKRKRLELYLDFERDVPEPALGTLREMVKRRAEGEPLQYVLGEASFCGLEIAVDKRVLIPRPETEMLVDYVLKNVTRAASSGFGVPALAGSGDPSAIQTQPAKAGTPNPASGPRIVDLGTGSGAIAIALAKNLPAARVMAVDASADALDVARANAAKHEVTVEFFHGDVFESLPADVKFDVIVSNPPYIPSGEIGSLAREIRDHEPVAALDGGADGLTVITRIARESKPRLEPGGRVVVELAAGQHEAAQRIFLDNGFRVEKMIADLNGHQRVLVAAIK